MWFSARLWKAWMWSRRSRMSEQAETRNPTKRSPSHNVVRCEVSFAQVVSSIMRTFTSKCRQYPWCFFTTEAHKTFTWKASGPTKDLLISSVAFLPHRVIQASAPIESKARLLSGQDILDPIAVYRTHSACRRLNDVTRSNFESHATQQRSRDGYP